MKSLPKSPSRTSIASMFGNGMFPVESQWSFMAWFKTTDGRASGG